MDINKYVYIYTHYAYNIGSYRASMIHGSHLFHNSHGPHRPSSLAKLVNISPITMVSMDVHAYGLNTGLVK